MAAGCPSPYGRRVGIEVRGYEPADRAAVRRICFETGYMGDPAAWQWADGESFADLFSRYYTDHEPESALVAEHEGEVVGYLLGCRDSRRVRSPAAMGGASMLRRGLLVRPGTAGVLWRSLGDLAAGAVRREPLPAGFDDDRWPAHLHIDLLSSARSQGVGRELIDRWLATLRDEDIPGCHLETWAENDGAIAFFAQMGFVRHGDPVPMPGLRSPEGHRHHTQVMVQSLRDPSNPSPEHAGARPEATVPPDAACSPEQAPPRAHAEASPGKARGQAEAKPRPTANPRPEQAQSSPEQAEARTEPGS